MPLQSFVFCGDVSRLFLQLELGSNAGKRRHVYHVQVTTIPVNSVRLSHSLTITGTWRPGTRASGWLRCAAGRDHTRMIIHSMPTPQSRSSYLNECKFAARGEGDASEPLWEVQKLPEMMGCPAESSRSPTPHPWTISSHRTSWQPWVASKISESTVSLSFLHSSCHPYACSSTGLAFIAYWGIVLFGYDT